MATSAKTLPRDAMVSAFLESLDTEKRRAESLHLMEAMQRLSGEPAIMWGPSIIGFGKYTYTYDSGHSGTSMRVGFSPRKTAMTLYIVPGYENKSELLERLGPHTLGKSCLYIKDLSKVDAKALEDIISMSLKEMAERYP
jgi:Domain of unknown function (DU1801)